MFRGFFVFMVHFYGKKKRNNDFMMSWKMLQFYIGSNFLRLRAALFKNEESQEFMLIFLDLNQNYLWERVVGIAFSQHYENGFSMSNL